MREVVDQIAPKYMCSPHRRKEKIPPPNGGIICAIVSLVA